MGQVTAELHKVFSVDDDRNPSVRKMPANHLRFELCLSRSASSDKHDIVAHEMLDDLLDEGVSRNLWYRTADPLDAL
jgi:hypothetical protein